MNDEALRVLVVADDLLARAGLAALLESRTDCDVVGQTSGGPALTADIAVFEPDVLVVDLGWLPMQTLSGIAPLADSDDDVPPVALLADESEAAAVVNGLLPFGAFGLLPRDSDPATISAALTAVADGLVAVDPTLTAALLPAVPAPVEPVAQPLTPRENDVLQLLAQGLTNKAIARDLGITDHTVKFHVNAILTKLGAQSRTEAVVRATRAGLIAL